MSRLDELIKEFCPNGVEFEEVENLCSISTGNQLNKSTIKGEGEYPVYNGGIYPSGYYHEYNTEFNSIAISQGGASAGYVNWVDVPFWAGAHCYVVKNISKLVLTRYLFFFLKNKQEHIQNSKHGAGIPSLNSKKIKQLQIPLPLLPIQEEIVRILDNFTQLEAELEAELEARKKQYEYFRNYLLTFGDGVPRVKLGDIADISRGVRVVKKQLKPDGPYPVYQNSLASMGYYDRHNCDANTTYVISAGAAGEIGFCEKDFWAADDCLVFSNLNGVINKYIYYFLMTKQDFIRSNVRKASIPRLSRTVIENLKIPLVSFEEQKRIVSILDRFDTLVNDIKQGLPAEIKARQKQYEYYREKLLTFKEIS